LMSSQVQASLAPEYLEVLNRHAWGPFSAAMQKERDHLESEIPVAKKIIEGLGYLDGANCTAISGWAWDGRQQDVSVAIQIFDGESLWRTAPAYRFRKDLSDSHIGTGKYGFVVSPGPEFKDGRKHTIHVRIAGTRNDIKQSPREISCP